MTLLLGIIADDFTGATDLANTLVKEGMPTVQLIGVPDGDWIWAMQRRLSSHLNPEQSPLNKL